MNELSRDVPARLPCKSRSGFPRYYLRRGRSSQSLRKKLQQDARTPRRETLIEKSNAKVRFFSFFTYLFLFPLSLSPFLSRFYFPDPNISAGTTYFVSFIVSVSAHGYLSAARCRIHRRSCRRDCFFEISTRLLLLHIINRLYSATPCVHD